MVQQTRRSRMAVIANSDAESLRALWANLALDPSFDYLRGPETGLVSLRGRIGGGGAPFPFGDATATRASVKLEDGRVGHAMLLGRNRERVTIAAVIDGICSDPAQAEMIDHGLIVPLQEATERRDKNRAEQTAATKVDFFTMTRGED